MGDDEFTQGRPHPMIDPTVRDARILAEASDPATAIIVFDVVLGYGASFGGYASLMAPVRAPGMFKCAFGYVGVYDAQIQLTQSDTAQSASGKRYLVRAFGETRAEQDAMSPITFADQIKLPVFLAAGARDQRTPATHTEAIQ